MGELGASVEEGMAGLAALSWDGVMGLVSTGDKESGERPRRRFLSSPLEESTWVWRAVWGWVLSAGGAGKSRADSPCSVG